MLPPILKTERLILKPYSINDEDRYVEIALDAISAQFMGGSTSNETEERKLFKKVFEVYQRSDERWFWIWGIYKDDLLCAHLEMKETENMNDNELEIVYMVHPTERQKGIMTEIFSLLMQKQKSWKKRITATVSPENLNSITLLKKWGITKKEILINKETGEEYFKLILDE